MRGMAVKGLVLSVSLLLVAILLEVGLRVVGYDVNPSPQWRFHPKLGWTTDPDAVPADFLQADGFRYDPSPEPVRTLLVLGDSFTAALNFPYRETLPGQLQSLLAESGESWRVVSLACDDWGQAQQLIALREYGRPLQPDAVVLQTFPLNDFCNNSRILAGTCSLQDSHRPYFESVEGELVETWQHPLRAWWRNRSRLFGLFENAFGTRVGQLPAGWMPQEADQDLRRREYFRMRARQAGLAHEGAVYSLLPPVHQPESIRAAWTATRAMAEAFAELTVRRGTPLIVAVIPFLKTFGRDWDQLKQAFAAPVERDFDTRAFVDYFEAAGARVVDVRSRIEEGDQPHQDYFISPVDGHLSRYGHAACADMIFAEIMSILNDREAASISKRSRRDGEPGDRIEDQHAR